MIYFCAEQNRRTRVLALPPLNGIDYLEIADAPDQTELLLTFLRDPTPLALTSAQVVILGGESVSNINTISIRPVVGVPATLRVKVDKAGDFSAYTLLLRANNATAEPPPNVDPALARIEFSFKAGCPVSGDCKPVTCCAPTPVWAPDINYLAKDYPGFVQVMLDRLAVVAPDWRERHAADLGVALVEVLAYVADHLSYQQDAVATEAYLGTARSRISLRRHARLVDYRVDEGENASVWIEARIRDGVEGVAVPVDTLILPRVAGLPPQLNPSGQSAEQLLKDETVVFATLTPATFGASLNSISFHTWSDEACCLPSGATAATLKGHLTSLAPGGVLLFEEMLGPLTGAPKDANQTHRCVVRLTSVHHTDRLGNAVRDPATGEAVTDITWDPVDALPFPLCLSAVTDRDHGARLVHDVSIARGNMVPADHRKPGTWEDLGVVPALPTMPVSGTTGSCAAPATQIRPPRPAYSPALSSAPLTFARDFDPNAPASALGRPAAFDAAPPKPKIEVEDNGGNAWQSKPDLLGLHPLDRGLTVEIESDGTAYLRFGDGEYGTAPAPGQSFRARYHTGNGAAGNVGAGTLGHALIADARIIGIHNPLPAAGGRDPDTMEMIRAFAPWRFRIQLRAVTETDYGDAALRDPAIRAAHGTLRWTGSWRTAFVTVDPAPRAPAPAVLAASTLARLDLLRMAGIDLAIEPAFIAGLRLALAICLKPHYARSDVEAALRRVFTAGPAPDGGPGLLDPMNFGFGQTVYLSPFIAAAQRVDGVASVRATAFQRVADPASDATAAGLITMQRLEIPRLDNNPSRPDHGILELAIEGGR
jgi:hypothetical protein